jgi:hypothetical protein
MKLGAYLYLRLYRPVCFFLVYDNGFAHSGSGQPRPYSRAKRPSHEGAGRHRQLALFPADREVPSYAEGHGVQVRFDGMELHRAAVFWFGSSRMPSSPSRSRP